MYVKSDKMPGKVKVKVLAGRNLPIMDRGSLTTDAYVEIKLGNICHKTEVAKKVRELRSKNVKTCLFTKIHFLLDTEPSMEFGLVPI